MSTRSYDSSGRRSAAARTQARVVATATELMTERGYAAISISDVAAAAEVSVALVYAAFGNKVGLLKRVLDAAVAGDDDPVPVRDREQARAAAAARGARKRCVLTAELITEIQHRMAPLASLLRDAAGTDAAARTMLEAQEAGRREGLGEFVAVLVADGQLRDGLDAEEATDLVWVLADPALYAKLVGTRAWTDASYAQWLGQTLYDSLIRAR